MHLRFERLYPLHINRLDTTQFYYRFEEREIALLALGQRRVHREERDDFLDDVAFALDLVAVAERMVVSFVSLYVDVAAPEALVESVEHRFVLVPEFHRELELYFRSSSLVRVDAHVKRSFTVDETDDVVRVKH